MDSFFNFVVLRGTIDILQINVLVALDYYFLVNIKIIVLDSLKLVELPDFIKNSIFSTHLSPNRTRNKLNSIVKAFAIFNFLRVYIFGNK